MTKKPRCVLTYVWNEPVWFPAWLGYYAHFFGAADIFVIHYCKPKPVPFDTWLPAQAKRGGFQLIHWDDSQYWDQQQTVELMMATVTHLLKAYERVLITDCDEFVCSPDGLGVYLDRFNGQVARATGFEVVHQFGDEHSIDWTRPLLPQRTLMYPSLCYSKPCVTTQLLHYSWGFHSCKEFEKLEPDPKLYLLHLHKIDRGEAAERRYNFARWSVWDEPKELSGEATHAPETKRSMHAEANEQNKLMGTALDEWWYKSIDDGKPAVYQKIPGWMRRLPMPLGDGSDRPLKTRVASTDQSGYEIVSKTSSWRPIEDHPAVKQELNRCPQA